MKFKVNDLIYNPDFPQNYYLVVKVDWRGEIGVYDLHTLPIREDGRAFLETIEEHRFTIYTTSCDEC